MNNLMAKFEDVLNTQRALVRAEMIVRHQLGDENIEARDAALTEALAVFQDGIDIASSITRDEFACALNDLVTQRRRG